MDTNIKTPSPITFQESKLKTIWIVLRFDLLKNLYLCGIINNFDDIITEEQSEKLCVRCQEFEKKL